MTYLEDSVSGRWGDRTVTQVGWLGDFVPTQGHVSDDHKQIINHLAGYHYWNADFLDYHSCEICGFGTATTGLGEIFIPSPTQKNHVFVAPRMLPHYIEVHKYKPPDDFLDAVLAWWESPAAAPCRQGKCFSINYWAMKSHCIVKEDSDDSLTLYAGRQADREFILDAFEYIFKKSIVLLNDHEDLVDAEFDRWSFVPELDHLHDSGETPTYRTVRASELEELQ